MPIDVKLDEDLSPMVAEPLRAAGHRVLTVHGQGWGGKPDSEVWQGVLAERVYFITADRGFGDIRAYPPGTHAGILVLNADRESLAAYRGLMESVVSGVGIDALAGTLAVVSASGVRIRRQGPGPTT